MPPAVPYRVVVLREVEGVVLLQEGLLGLLGSGRVVIRLAHLVPVVLLRGGRAAVVPDVWRVVDDRSQLDVAIYLTSACCRLLTLNANV